MMRRSVLSTKAQLSIAARSYTDYTHMKFPPNTVVVNLTLLYFVGLFCFYMRMGTLYTGREEYKHDYLRIWRRKLGTGYKWAEDWGPEVKTIFKDLPSSVA